MRLGFAVKVLGKPGLKSHDTRRWQSGPHLSVSLAYLRDVLLYLKQIDVHMYRMSSDLAPYVTHPDMPQFHSQIQECEGELAALGARALEDGLRLSFHPGAHVVLNSPSESVAAKATADIVAQARILDLMGLGPEAVIVTHVGGVYDDKPRALNRFVERYMGLPEPARRRLVLENDERGYSIGDVSTIHERTGIRLVLDVLHYQCCPTPGTSLNAALHLALRTWPADQTPKVHYSTPRTALVSTEQRSASGQRQHVVRQPRLCQHADLIDPFSFIALLDSARDSRDFDVMLECKAKDLALLRLRGHLDRLARGLVAHHHLM
jgi:UV DNA damage endonuclease